MDETPSAEASLRRAVDFVPRDRGLRRRSAPGRSNARYLANCSIDRPPGLVEPGTALYDIALYVDGAAISATATP